MKKPLLLLSHLFVTSTLNKLPSAARCRLVFLSLLMFGLVTGPTQQSFAHENNARNTVVVSTDASLKLLLLSSHTALTQASGPANVNYTTSVSNGTASITVTPTVSNAGATVTVNGIAVASGTASAPIALNAGPTTINLLVTAQDGITTKSYSITVNQAKSNDASLAALTLSTRTPLALTTGPANINFSTTIINSINSVTVTPRTFNAGATVTVNGVAVTSGTASTQIPLNIGGPTVINLLVTAQDGVTKESYSVTVNRPSTDANLQLLLLSSHSALTPASGPANVNYTTSVSNSTTSLTLTPTAENGGATITVNGTPVASGANSNPILLNTGSPTTINLLVTAQDGITTQSYSIVVTRAKSNDASLATLTLDTYTSLTSTTGPANVNFATVVGNAITSLTLIPTTFNAAATVTVNGIPVTSGTASGPIALNTGSTVINLLVTAEDGVTTASYSITVNRPSTDASLKLLLLSSHTALVQSAGPANVNYTTSVNNPTASLSVTATTSDPNATVTVNGIPVTSGTASGAVALNAGSPTVIPVVVTAQDGVTTKSYSITVNQGGSNDASLVSLTLSSGTALTQTTGPANVNFATSVVSTTTSLNVTPTTFNAGATVTVNGTAVTSGTASTAIPLNASGTTVINLLVTAQDGVTTASYSITVTKLPSTDAGLKLIALSTHTGLQSTSGPANVNYATSVSNGTTSLTLTPTASDPNAVITVNGATVTSGTASGPIPLNVGNPTTINLHVTAQDGITTLSFSIVVNQNGSNDARLKGLTLNTQTALTITSGTADVNFATTVNNGTASIRLTPTADDPSGNATITVNGSPVTSGTASAPIVLNAGPTTIVLLVTAQDGVTTESYSVTVSQSAGFTPGFSTYQALAVNNIIENPLLATDDGVMVHQGLSPNGDGINDYLVIEGLAAYPDNKLMIMNRSGQKVFEAQGYDNNNRIFDGHSNITGILQLPGTYFYSLEYRSGTEIKHKTGYIIIRY